MKDIIVACLFCCCFGFYHITNAQETILYPSDVVSSLRFGNAVTAYGDYIAVGTRGGSNSGLAEGVYVFRKDGTNWIEEERLTVTDSVMDQCFGCNMAMYEDYLLIGAPSDGENGENAGAAYIFKKQGEEWENQIKLMPSDATDNQNFGGHVSIYGNYALIGAPKDKINNQFSSGSAYIFKRDGNQWLEEAKLIPSDPTFSTIFGNFVFIHETYAFVGAPRAYDSDNMRTGAIYVFKNNGSDWVEETKLIANDSQHDDAFSIPIAIGNTLFVAAVKAPGSNAYYKGAGYIFSENGGSWTEERKLIPYDGEDDNRSLWSWGFNEEYAVLANADNPHSGIVHLFHKKNDDWSKVKTLTASNGDQFDRYGSTSFLENNTLIVGAWDNFYQDSESIRTGAVYVYDLDLLVANKDVESLETSIQVFPNPSSQSLTVAMNGAVVSDFKQLAIYDMNGRLLQHVSRATFEKTKDIWMIDISHLTSGAYILRAVSRDHVVSNRFVKM